MALVIADRVKETTTTTGTGTVTLLGASTGYQSFAAVGNGNTTYYTIAGQTSSEWEVGIGTYTSSGTTLSRTTVLASSNSGSLVNFSAGTKDVFVTYPAEKSVNQDASGNVAITYNTAGSGAIGSLNVGGSLNGVTDTGIIQSLVGTADTYVFTALQNKNTGATANTSYSSYALYNNTGSVYGEIGLNSNNYSYSAAGFPNNSLSLANATFMEAGTGSDLVLATYGSTAIHFVVNATSATADALTISTAGAVTTPNTLTGSNVVASNGLHVNSQTVSASYTIAAGSSAMSAGPISVASGVSVTLGSGSRWVVI
jgi:hypothetical protein